MPTIGFLHSGSAETNAKRLAGFRKGLGAAGFVEGRNVAIEFRWADGHNDRLAGMAADLIRRPVTVIATLSTTVAALAAQAATRTIPIVFLIAEDPVKLGLAKSFNQPGGNATGITSLNSEIAAKRLGLLHDTLPKAAVAVLVNPSQSQRETGAGGRRSDGPEARAAAATSECQHRWRDRRGFRRDQARHGAAGQHRPVLFLAARDSSLRWPRAMRCPRCTTIANSRPAGGLMSYGTDIPSGWEQCGVTVGRILKGEKPADLPIVQAAKFETVFNLKTAKALGIEIPSKLLFTADEVIE